MRKSFLLSSIAAIATLAAAMTYSSIVSADSAKIIIKGSTTVLPITQKAIEAYPESVAKKVAISVDGSGSGNGIKAIMDGTCDIANSSRAMKKEELAKAKEKKLRIKEIVVAWDMIVPVVHPKNPVASLTKDQLKGIYEGTIKNWKEVGGPDMRIVVISRDTSSGTYEFWYEDVLKKTNVRKDALLPASNGAVVATVANNEKAIGYIGFGYLNNSIKAVKVNGIEPTLKNAKAKKNRYPIARELYMYVNENKYTPQAKAFVKFLLGKKGQELVKSAGYIPL